MEPPHDTEDTAESVNEDEDKNTSEHVVYVLLSIKF